MRKMKKEKNINVAYTRTQKQNYVNEVDFLQYWRFGLVVTR